MSTSHLSPDHWVSVLSAALGQTIQPVETGGCVLEFEGDIRVVVEPLPNTGLLAFRAALTFPGHPVSAETMRTALTLNHAQLPPGYTLALDEHGGQLALLALIGAAEDSPEALLEVLGGFLEWVPQLRHLLAQADAAQHESVQHKPASAFADFRA